MPPRHIFVVCGGRTIAGRMEAISVEPLAALA